MLFQKSPQFSRHSISFRFLSFCAILFHRDGLLLSVGLGKPRFSRSHLTFQDLFFG
jgi:hypothetical protein